MFVGIDVSKERLDAHARPSGAPRCLPHDVAGLQTLLRWLLARAPTLVVVEATGGLERRLVRALSTAGLAVAVVNPRQARRFAQALGLLAKTDRIDGRGLALYGARIRPEPRAQPSPALERLAALVARRRQLSDLGVQEQNRLGQAVAPLVRRQIDDTLALLARPRRGRGRARRCGRRRSRLVRARDFPARPQEPSETPEFPRRPAAILPAVLA